jgi:hypothetical protein
MERAVLRENVSARLAALAGPGKLASRIAARHKRCMRHLITASLLFVAACAPRPVATPAPVQSPATAQAATVAGQHDHRTLNGMTANELVEHFGRPRLQIREGEGTKLQFAGPNCVLDFYLYPAQGGAPRVSHIDARNFQGGNVSPQACVYAIEGARGAR